MISDLSVVVISVSVIMLCWAVVRINQKIDETIRNPNNDNMLDGWPTSDQRPADTSREASTRTPS